ncbi:esterase/lipase family protein [Nocardia panacis]|uniref:esterase/lipase family protein n=1 Tax=Nocardia panacis TaxID=2340916 RepID=UPI001EF0439C|nr:alpha/beta fold hydrolase [Nocardia panacis]
MSLFTIAFAAVLGVLAPSAAATAPLSQQDVPAGVNDPRCALSAAHPDPVVLVHGSATDVQGSFAVMAPVIEQAGFCVFAANIGRAPVPADIASGRAGIPGLNAIEAALTGRTVHGMAEIPAMADELTSVIRMVREATGARRVALVGHSTGGTVIRQYLRSNGGDAVSTVVTLGTPYRGSTWNGLRAAYPELAKIGLDNAQIATQVFGAPGRQQLPDASLLHALNAFGETVPGVRYTAIASRYDEVITPTDTALLGATGDGNRNIWLQDGCPSDSAGHSQLLVDPRSLALVLQALGEQGRILPC